MRLRVRRSKRRCPLCREALDGTATVQACAGCGTDYHPECLRELGGCSTLGCSRRGAAAGEPAESAARGNEVFGDLLRHPAVTALSGHALKVDQTTTMEALLAGGWCLTLSSVGVLLFGAFQAQRLELALVALVPGLLFVLFAVLAARTDNYYVVDFERQELLYSRNVLSKRSLQRVAGFDGLAGFAVDCEKRSSKHSSWFVYYVDAIHRRGARTRLTDSDRSLARADQLATGLAERSGTRAWKGRAGRKIKLRSAGGQVAVTYVPIS